ncbi:UNVERIFIED_CONTAM: hypothetical protein K2H54_004208 [Gekko kuhli]
MSLAQLTSWRLCLLSTKEAVDQLPCKAGCDLILCLQHPETWAIKGVVLAVPDDRNMKPAGLTQQPTQLFCLCCPLPLGRVDRRMAKVKPELTDHQQYLL